MYVYNPPPLPRFIYPTDFLNLSFWMFHGHLKLDILKVENIISHPLPLPTKYYSSIVSHSLFDLLLWNLWRPPLLFSVFHTPLSVCEQNVTRPLKYIPNLCLPNSILRASAQATTTSSPIYFIAIAPNGSFILCLPLVCFQEPPE